MKALLQAISRDPWKTCAKHLSLAIVYQDSHTHEQATAAYESLLQALGTQAELTATWWRTSILADPKLAEAAARCIATSDLILFSVRGDRDPSPAVRSWIEKWGAVSTLQPRLLALLECANVSGTSAWPSILEAVANRAEMAYVAGLARPAADDSDSMGGRKGWASNRVIEPYQHWGLNE